MEIEYKYAVPGAAALEALAADARVRLAAAEGFQTVAMRARYYDTPAGLLRQSQATLRLREETPEGAPPRTLCCFKQKPQSGTPEEGGDGALSVREEYECPARDAAEGLRGLSRLGAPRALLQAALREGLRQTAALSYTRRLAYLRLAGGLECEICLDRGAFDRPGGEKEPFWELELEYKAGPRRTLEVFAAALAADYGLRPQPLSKHARALG